MNIRNLLLLSATAFSVLMLAACKADTDPEIDVLDIPVVKENALIAPTYGESDVPAETAARGANTFAFHFAKALLADQEAKDDNFICSPYSAWLPLAALINASDDTNKQQYFTALGAAGLTADDMNRTASRMLYDLTNIEMQEMAEEYGYEAYNPLRIANAVFVDNNYTLNQNFAQTFMDYYRGQAISVDFASPEAAKAVNQWAADHTDGLITDIIQEFDPETVATMANAIYYSDRWTWEFKEEETKEDVFYSPAGEKTASYMKRVGDAQTYYEDDRLQAIPLNLLSGGSMYILLPKDGDANALLTAMTPEYFEEIQSDSIQASGTLLLPRFKVESGLMDLKAILTQMGIPLFNEQDAPLTGGLIEEDIPLWLSGAAQKAVISVDEKGTTAAAVTVMPVAGAAMPVPTEPFEMNCNQPFVFILSGRTYDGGEQILFIGVMNDPES